MCMMKVHPSSDDMFIVMAGFNHVHNIASHMPKTRKERLISLFDQTGVLSPESPPPPTQMSVAPTNLLSQFRAARHNKAKLD